MMKRVVTMMMILMMMVSCASAEMVERHGVVVAIDYIEDTFTVLSDNGNLWVFDEIEDMMLADEVLMLMDTNGTETAEDDTIVQWRYTGAMELDSFFSWLNAIDED